MKRIRLELEAYRLGHCFSVTIGAVERGQLFADPMTVEACLAALKQSAEKYEAAVYAYCFMPDHLHLLARTPVGISFIDFIRHLKQLSAYRLRRQAGARGPIWQRRFYDHALRSDEGVLAAARYIFENPARAGIVADADDYPYSGSFVWEEALASSGSEDPDLLHRLNGQAITI